MDREILIKIADILEEKADKHAVRGADNPSEFVVATSLIEVANSIRILTSR